MHVPVSLAMPVQVFVDRRPVRIFVCSHPHLEASKEHSSVRDLALPGLSATHRMASGDILPPLPHTHRILLQAGASPWCQDHNFHRTCLHYAAATGHSAVIAPVVERSRSSQHPTATSLFGRLSVKGPEDGPANR